MEFENLELANDDLLMEIPEEFYNDEKSNESDAKQVKPTKEDKTSKSKIIDRSFEEPEISEEDGINVDELDIPKEEEEVEDEIKDSKSSDEVSPFSILAEDIKENSEILASIDEDRIKGVKTLAEFRELFVEDFKIAQEEWISSLNDNAKGLVKHIQNGGKVSDFIDVYKEDDYSNIDKTKLSEDESLQNRIILDLFKELGISSEKAKKKLDRIIDKEEEALDALEELQKIKDNKKKALEEVTKKEAEDRKKQYEDMWKTIETNTNSIEEFIPGKKLDKRVKETVFKSINDIWSEVVSNPTKYAHTLAYLKYYKILDGDFSKIEIDAVSKANKNLGKILEKGAKATSNEVSDEERRQAMIFSIMKNKKK